MDMRNNILVLFIIFAFLLNRHILYAQKILYENPNEISDYYKELINKGEINPLSMLKTIYEKGYNYIISFIPENEVIENYYYDIIIHVKTNGNKQVTIDENGIVNLPEDRVLNFEYKIYYYERFFNKYNTWRGDPTGKCFSVLFNEKGEFIEKYSWK